MPAAGTTKACTQRARRQRARSTRLARVLRACQARTFSRRARNVSSSCKLVSFKRPVAKTVSCSVRMLCPLCCNRPALRRPSHGGTRARGTALQNSFPRRLGPRAQRALRSESLSSVASAVSTAQLCLPFFPKTCIAHAYMACDLPRRGRIRPFLHLPCPSNFVGSFKRSKSYL